jgi:hypothetical protein
VAETTVKRIVCCGFRRTGKAKGVEDMSRNKCFFFRFENQIFYVLYPFVACLLTFHLSLRRTAWTVFLIRR